jgi:hypothetical protein
MHIGKDRCDEARCKDQDRCHRAAYRGCHGRFSSRIKKAPYIGPLLLSRRASTQHNTVTAAPILRAGGVSPMHDLPGGMRLERLAQLDRTSSLTVRTPQRPPPHEQSTSFFLRSIPPRTPPLPCTGPNLPACETMHGLLDLPDPGHPLVRPSRQMRFPPLAGRRIAATRAPSPGAIPAVR